ncbi:MAG: MoxR family ATPase [Pyrinomonadaceae bacterium]
MAAEPVIEGAKKSFEFYRGDGRKVTERGMETPAYDPPAGADAPAGYVAGEGLRDAVNVALLLGQPLLVTGEPGTGKTQLAYSVAYELELGPPVVFHTKTTSAAKDLFYRYDALRHFNDVNIIKKDEAPGLSVEDDAGVVKKDEAEKSPVEGYIKYEALGKAILRARGEAGAPPTRSVVLIDEVDKAPRDFPNDILHEIDKFSFTVSETGRTFTADARSRPIVILTSNSEKNLPDAFLRRCVFYHIPPPGHAQLKEIAQRRLEMHDGFPAVLDTLITHFEEIRTLALRKRPATAELLAWLGVLDRLKVDEAALQPGRAEALAFTYAILAKNKDDKDLMQRLKFKL